MRRPASTESTRAEREGAGVQAASPENPHLRWHEWFKYAVYGLLTLNIVLFFREEWEAAGYLFGAGPVPPGEIISAFSASIDTLAWVVLLLVFELETYQIPDEKLKPPLTTVLHGVRIGCYGFIVYAAYGYLAKMLGMYGYELAEIAEVCALQGHSLLLTLDEFEPLSAANCAALTGESGLRVLPGAGVLATPEVWGAATRLAWLDVFNSITWILVVALLELDVRLQAHHHLIGAWRRFSEYAKFLLYAVLFAAAVYWGVDGAFLDFWDAFLWLVAFVFIELNVFEWREELAEARPAAAGG